MAKTRIYLVQPNVVIDGKPAPARLVEAVTPSQAIRHVSKNMFVISVATPKGVAQLVKAGTELETATEEEQEKPPMLPLDPPPPLPDEPAGKSDPDDFGKGEAPKYITREEEKEADAQNRRAHRRGK